MKQSDLLPQRYLITLSNNPAFKGEIPTNESFAEPKVIEANGYCLFVDHVNTDGKSVGGSAQRRGVSVSRIADILAKFEWGKTIAKLVCKKFAPNPPPWFGKDDKENMQALRDFLFGDSPDQAPKK